MAGKQGRCRRRRYRRGSACACISVRIQGKPTTHARPPLASSRPVFHLGGFDKRRAKEGDGDRTARHGVRSKRCVSRELGACMHGRQQHLQQAGRSDPSLRLAGAFSEVSPNSGSRARLMISDKAVCLSLSWSFACGGLGVGKRCGCYAHRACPELKTAPRRRASCRPLFWGTSGRSEWMML